MTEIFTPTRRVPWLWLLGAVIAIALAGGGVAAWRGWEAHQAAQQRQADIQRQRWNNMQRLLDTLRGDQRLTSEHLQDVTAANRVLREEILGLGQRSALLEETVQRLSNPNQYGAQALHLEEIAMLLRLGQQRLMLAGDADSARHAYALASSILDGIDDPAYLSLRQTLLQERAVLDHLGKGPQIELSHTLDSLATGLERLPQQVAVPTQARPWWQKLLSPLVDIRSTHGQILVGASERRGAIDALQIEISLARVAAERGDGAGFHQTLRRIEDWLTRLWPDSPQRRAYRTQLRALEQIRLRPQLPELGTTLRQLHTMREGRTSQ